MINDHLFFFSVILMLTVYTVVRLLCSHHLKIINSMNSVKNTTKTEWNIFHRIDFAMIGILPKSDKPRRWLWNSAIIISDITIWILCICTVQKNHFAFTKFKSIFIWGNALALHFITAVYIRSSYRDLPIEIIIIWLFVR